LIQTLSDFEQDIIDWLVAWPSEITSACWWQTLQAYALKLIIICLNCQCKLIHLLAIFYLILKCEFVFTCIFGVLTPQGSVATLIRCGELYSQRDICRLFLIPALKTAVKSVDL